MFKYSRALDSKSNGNRRKAVFSDSHVPEAKHNFTTEVAAQKKSQQQEVVRAFFAVPGSRDPGRIISLIMFNQIEKYRKVVQWKQEVLISTEPALICCIFGRAENTQSFSTHDHQSSYSRS